MCESAWDKTHRFLWNFVGDLVGLVQEAHGGDVAQRCKTPEEEEQQSSRGQTKKKEKNRKEENQLECEKAANRSLFRLEKKNLLKDKSELLL